MFGSLGMPELLVILVIALMVFGPRRLPELGRSLGQTLNEFKKGANALRESVEAEIEQDNQRHAAATSTTTPAPPPGAPSGTEPRQV